MFTKPLWQTVWTQIRLGALCICSGSTLFASILNSSLLLGNYLQQTTSADVIFRMHFFLGALRVNGLIQSHFILLLLSGLIASVFAGRYEEAFGCCRLVQGLAGIIVFVMSENLCMLNKILVTMAACVLSLILYIIMEVTRKICKGDAVNQEVEITVN